MLNSYGPFSVTILLIGDLENRSFRKYQKCEEILLKFIHFLLNVWFLDLNFINHFMYNVKKWPNILNPLSSNPQNGQAHPNNFSAKFDELFECIQPFCRVGA